MRRAELKPDKTLELSVGSSGEGFAFDHETGVVFHLNRLGAWILQELQAGPREPEALADSIVGRCQDADPAEVRSDVEEFVEQLTREGLARWTDE